MAIEFAHDPQVVALAERTKAFIRDAVIGVEESCGGVLIGDEGELTRQKLQRAAEDAGVFVPHAAVEHGGHALDMRAQAPVFEEAGYSLFGPLALNIAAPDEANIHLLERVATTEQKERYLRPLVSGAVRSCFAMTGPTPGVGATRTALNTVATRVAGGWRVTGHEWCVAGAHGAAFAIWMARTSGAVGGTTMFVVDTNVQGLKLVGPDIETLDQSRSAAHAELVFDNCFVPDDAALGEVGRGFDYARMRLGPALLTQSMRRLGIARRAQDISLARVNERRPCGSRLAELAMAPQTIADNEIDIAASRALILRACWELDHGGSATQSVSVAKTYVGDAVRRIVDRSVRLCGSLGGSGDKLLSRLMREVRPFRMYDGPSETHRWAIAKRAAKSARLSA